MKIYNLLEKFEYAKEVIELCLNEWGNYIDEEEKQIKITNKLKKFKNKDRNEICQLILLDDMKLIGFISLLKTDSKEVNLTPWYGTMYVKHEHRGNGYSKILNDSIIKEAKKIGYKKLYLKTDLINYYEKFGFIYLKKLNNGENLYYQNI